LSVSADAVGINIFVPQVSIIPGLRRSLTLDAFSPLACLGLALQLIGVDLFDLARAWRLFLWRCNARPMFTVELKAPRLRFVIQSASGNAPVGPDGLPRVSGMCFSVRLVLLAPVIPKIKPFFAELGLDGHTDP
jgi:hypothetical protein